MLPSIIFSAWDREIRPGDLLFSGDTFIGFVTDYDYQARRGRALPSVFLRPLLRKRLSANGKNGLLPHPGFETEPVADPILKTFFGMGADESGVIISRLYPFSPAAEVLEKGDVILRVDGRTLAPGGEIHNVVFGKLPLQAGIILKGGGLLSEKDSLALLISRNGRRRELNIRLESWEEKNYRVPGRFDRPRYLIYGGLVFVELSGAYIRESRTKSARLRFLAARRLYRSVQNDERYVVLDRILPHAINRGYEYSRLLTESVHGRTVRNLKHLKSLLKQSPPKEPIVIRLEGGREIVLDPARTRQADRTLLKQYDIQFADNLK